MVSAAHEDSQSPLHMPLPSVAEAVDKFRGQDGSLKKDLLAQAVIKRSLTPMVGDLIDSLPELSDKAREALENDDSVFSIDEAVLVSQLSKLGKKPGELENFALKFAEAVYVSGGAKPSKIGDDTYEVLQSIGKEMLALRELPATDSAPKGEKTLAGLRALAEKLEGHAKENENLRSPDYVALNEQYRQISLAIRKEEDSFLGTLPKKMLSALQERGLAPLADADQWGQYKVDHVSNLLRIGLLEKTHLPGIGEAIAFSQADPVHTHFEQVVPPRTRESISQSLWVEFKTKYGNRFDPLGTPETRPDGIISLRDRVRLESVAAKAGVSVAFVELTLKYLHQHGLVKVNEGGYELSAQGQHAGIGMRAIRFIQRAEQLGSSTTGEVSIEKYLEAARSVRETWKMPTYTLQTKDGGCPWVYLLDELYAGNARIDERILKRVIKNVQETDNALVIASNMFQGDAAVEPRAMRTSIPAHATGGVDFRDYGNQVKLVKQLLSSLGHPVLQLHGKTDLETANLRADVQRERDLQALKGREKPDEGSIVTALSKLNEISERAGRKYNAKLQAEILDFVANVVMPLEIKLGRELMDSPTVRSLAGLDMNELEIVRDMVGLLVEDARSASVEGRKKVQSLYGDFLSLSDVGNDYLAKLQQVIFPESETLEANSPVARGGAMIQLMTPEGEKGLKIIGLPDVRFGLGEITNPTEKIIRIIKSKTLAGDEIPDIVCAGATGQPYVSMTAGGTMIVSADTLQASNFDDLYSFTESQDRHKRRRFSRGGESYGGSIAFSGGIDKGYKTDAYTLRLWNNKIEEVLLANKAAGMPSRYVDIYSTSDWQTGSPTAKPATWLRGLFWALQNDQKEIVINGDVFQGQNYGRAPIEMQMTGLVGIEDQQAFVHALLNPILDTIKLMRDADPNWEIPKFKILTGNHETNSQSGKGGQGIWFLQTVASQIESFYRGAFGSEVAESHVLYPKKFVDRLGIDVDYSHVLMDFSKETGFRVAAQHYVGAGAKGSSCAPPITAAQTWARSMENELRPVHGFLFGHWHTQSVTQADGVWYAIFGANADKSGFEWHLGYPTTVPASGRVRLYSDRAPELFFVTDPYLRLQEEELRAVPTYKALIDKYGSLEDYIEYERARHQRRDQKAYSYTEAKFGQHNFLDANRKIGGEKDAGRNRDAA